MSTLPPSSQTVELNAENAVKLLHTFVEQAQRGQAIKSLADAATLHRALLFLKNLVGIPSTTDVDEKGPPFTLRSALSLCLQAIERGQAVGVYSLEEAHNAAAVLTYLMNNVQEPGDKSGTSASTTK